MIDFIKLEAGSKFQKLRKTILLSFPCLGAGIVVFDKMNVLFVLISLELKEMKMNNTFFNLTNIHFLNYG